MSWTIASPLRWTDVGLDCSNYHVHADNYDDDDIHVYNNDLP